MGHNPEAEVRKAEQHRGHAKGVSDQPPGCAPGQLWAFQAAQVARKGLEKRYWLDLRPRNGLGHCTPIETGLGQGVGCGGMLLNSIGCASFYEMSGGIQSRLCHLV